jgi:flagellar hook-length control protein FliK
MSALDLLTVLSAPAAAGGGSGASAGADADAAGVFSGFLALHAPDSAKTSRQQGADVDAAVNDGEDEPQPFAGLAPFAPPPASPEVAAGPLLAIQGQAISPDPTLAGPLPAPEGDMGVAGGEDMQKAALPSGLPDADGSTGPASTGSSPAAVAAPETPAPRPAFPSTELAAADTGDAAPPAADPGVKTGGTEPGSAPAPSAVAAASRNPALAPAPAAAPMPAPVAASPEESAQTAPASGSLAAAEAGEPPASALQRPSSGAVEAVQTAARGALPPGEPGQAMQRARSQMDDAGRRSDRREPFTNPLLTSASDTTQPPSPAPGGQNTSTVSPLLQPGGLNLAQAQAGQPGPMKTEITPPPVDAALPQGEGEAARALDTASSAPVTTRDGLPSGLSRATIETTAMMSAQIVRRLEARSTRFDMVLTPEDLGRVDVRMEVDSEGQLTARLAFDNPAAAAELRGRADELRRQLEAAGFQLSDSSLQFAERDGGRRDQPFDQRGRAFAGAGRLADTADSLSAPPRWTALSLTPEGVDMKV